MNPLLQCLCGGTFERLKEAPDHLRDNGQTFYACRCGRIFSGSGRYSQRLQCSCGRAVTEFEYSHSVGELGGYSCLCGKTHLTEEIATGDEPFPWERANRDLRDALRLPEKESMKPKRTWFKGEVKKRRLDDLVESTRKQNRQIDELKAQVLEAWPDDFDEFAYLEVDSECYGTFLAGVRKGPRGDDLIFEGCSDPAEGWWPLGRPPVVIVQILTALVEVLEETESHWGPWSNPDLDRPIEDLKLPVRKGRKWPIHWPIRYKTIADVARSTESELLEIHGLGVKALSDIKHALDDMGLCLGMFMDEQGHEYDEYVTKEKTDV